MKSPKVSVIIPVYNAENTIGGILDKLITQDYKNIEIIVVNDGSKDGSLRILKAFSARDKRVLVLSQNNGGASAARNAGIKKASGKYITFIDSDDDIDKSLISSLAYGAEDGGEFVLCGMSIYGKDIIASQANISGKSEIVQYVIGSLLTKNLLYGPYCKLFKTSLIKTNNISFPENVHYGEDTIFVLDYLSKVSSMRIISKSLYRYRIAQTGLAMSNRIVPEFRKARSRALSRFVGHKPKTPIKVMLILLRLRWSMAYVKSRFVRLGA